MAKSQKNENGSSSKHSKPLNDQNAASLDSNIKPHQQRIWIVENTRLVPTEHAGQLQGSKPLNEMLDDDVRKPGYI